MKCQSYNVRTVWNVKCLLLHSLAVCCSDQTSNWHNNYRWCIAFSCTIGPRFITNKMETFSLPSRKFSPFTTYFKTFPSEQDITTDSRQRSELGRRKRAEKKKVSQQTRTQSLIIYRCDKSHEAVNTCAKCTFNLRMLNCGGTAQIIQFYFKMQTNLGGQENIHASSILNW